VDCRVGGVVAADQGRELRFSGDVFGVVAHGDEKLVQVRLWKKTCFESLSSCLCI